MEKPTVLVTNDDGIYADGISGLLGVLSKKYQVVTVAPLHEKSACSHSLTLRDSLRIIKKADDFYAVTGTPVDCINIALKHILKSKPSLIVSGINMGFNLAQDSYYSGTVAAAREGALQDIYSFAISTDRNVKNYGNVALFADIVIKKILEFGLPKKVFLNVNMPSTVYEDSFNFKITKMGKKIYSNPVVEREDPRGRKYYWLGGFDSGFEGDPDSDCAVVEAGNISITPLHIDATDSDFLKNSKKWGF